MAGVAAVAVAAAVAAAAGAGAEAGAAAAAARCALLTAWPRVCIPSARLASRPLARLASPPRGGDLSLSFYTCIYSTRAGARLVWREAPLAALP